MRAFYHIFARFSGAWLLLVVVVSPAVTAPEAGSLEERPFLAIWRDSGGFRRSEAPYLRVAIWSDGRIVFAKDPKKWQHELLEGRIEAARVTELKKAIEATGVFDLKGNCYL